MEKKKADWMAIVVLFTVLGRPRGHDFRLVGISFGQTGRLSAEKASFFGRIEQQLGPSLSAFSP